jgi:hypothetical protein
MHIVPAVCQDNSTFVKPVTGLKLAGGKLLRIACQELNFHKSLVMIWRSKILVRVRD